MTYIEKYMELRPDDNALNTMLTRCPTTMFKNARLLCKEESHGTIGEKCLQCWNREYSGEEVR